MHTITPGADPVANTFRITVHSGDRLLEVEFTESEAGLLAADLIGWLAARDKDLAGQLVAAIYTTSLAVLVRKDDGAQSDASAR